MTSHDQEHIRELLVPFTLGVLSDDESRIVRDALAESPQLRAELSEIEQTSAALVHGSMPIEPAPSFIKARVLDSIGAAERSSTASRKRADRRRRRWNVLLPSIAAAGLTGACMVLGIVALSLHNDLDKANDRLDAANERVRQVPSDIALRPVSTSGAMEPASGQLIRVASDRYVLLLHDVPNPGVGNSWQVWTADSRGKVRNVGQWVDGAATQAILLTSDDVREVMVSHEHSLRPMTSPSSDPMAAVTI